MSLSLPLATLLPGLVLLALGAALAANTSAIRATFQAMPRSRNAATVFFGVGALWFLFRVWHLPEADFGEYRTFLFVAFAAIAIGAVFYVPDFLAVRGLAVLTLMSAMPLLDAAYMHYEAAQRLFLVSLVYLAIALAIWLGAQPWRLRDFLEWLYRTPGRPRALGGSLAAYGLLLCVVSMTY